MSGAKLTETEFSKNEGEFCKKKLDKSYLQLGFMLIGMYVYYSWINRHCLDNSAILENSTYVSHTICIIFFVFFKMISNDLKMVSI